MLSQTPLDIQVNYTDVFLETSDKQDIHGWYVPYSGAKQTVLFLHGNAGNISSRLFRVKFYQSLNVNLFILDYRGYGKSKGRPSEQGLYKDVRAAYDYLVKEQNVETSQILVHGKSLGCAVAIDLCLDNEVGYLILESPFSSVPNIAKEVYPFLPCQLLSHQKYDNVSKIKSINVPKLILHGRYDDMIGYEHASLLHENAKQPKVLLPYDGGHNDIDYVTSDEFKTRVATILKEMKSKK